MEVVGCLFGHQGVPELAFEGRDRLGRNHEAFRIMRSAAEDRTAVESIPFGQRHYSRQIDNG